MQEIFQQTLNKEIILEGIGLHSGKNSKIKLIPSSEDKGIIFVRTDLKKNNIIKANYKNVSSARLCTTLENSSGSKVSTVEHLLAAFYIIGVDNVIVEVNNEEIPIMDGSSKDFIEILNKVGTRRLDKKRKFLKILNKVELSDKEKKSMTYCMEYIYIYIYIYIGGWGKALTGKSFRFVRACVCPVSIA